MSDRKPEFFLIKWVEKVERHYETEEKPVVSKVPGYLVQGLRGFAEEVHQYALVDSFPEVNEDHLES